MKLSLCCYSGREVGETRLISTKPGRRGWSGRVKLSRALQRIAPNV